MNEFKERTDEEILARVEAQRPADFLGFANVDLIGRLPFALAKQFLVAKATEEKWQQMPRDRVSLVTQMLEYADFAWEKIENERGISASRSMGHYGSWVWLAGDDLGDLRNFMDYGRANMTRICEHYNKTMLLVEKESALLEAGCTVAARDPDVLGMFDGDFMITNGPEARDSNPVIATGFAIVGKGRDDVVTRAYELLKTSQKRAKGA